MFKFRNRSVETARPVGNPEQISSESVVQSRLIHNGSHVATTPAELAIRLQSRCSVLQGSEKYMRRSRGFWSLWRTNHVFKSACAFAPTKPSARVNILPMSSLMCRHNQNSRIHLPYALSPAIESVTCTRLILKSHASHVLAFSEERPKFLRKWCVV